MKVATVTVQRRAAWSIEEIGACFIVRDHRGQKLAYGSYRSCVAKLTRSVHALDQTGVSNASPMRSRRRHLHSNQHFNRVPSPRHNRHRSRRPNRHFANQRHNLRPSHTLRPKP
jgi:hypothetical protein